MRRIVHICWGLEPTNGAANIARMIASEQRAAGHDVRLSSRLSARAVRAADELWCHCGWYYGIWLAVFWAKLFGKRVRWVPECCYDPVRLAYHGWKKRLAGPFERWALRQSDEVLATCAAEADWVRAYEPRVKRVALTDIKRFFRFDAAGCAAKRAAVRERRGALPLRALFMGRPHPLKGTDFLRRAADELHGRVELRAASSAQGEEKEALWRWADVLVLPTLSDNFGLVVAEALSRGTPVITTDGAPAWLDLSAPYGTCLTGYRDGTPERRVALLREALLAAMAGHL